MLKKNSKMLIITSAVILLPILAGLILWNNLPEQMPIHWNVAGEVDGWCGKAVAVFGFPLLLLVFHWITVFTTLADPKEQNHTGAIRVLRFLLIPALSIVLSAIIYIGSLGIKVQVNLILPLLLGVLFIALGVTLPKCRHNYTIGIKIPWTLNSEENWNKTHRLTGIVWTVGGVLTALVAFIDCIWLVIPLCAVMVFVPMIYSYVLHTKGI